MAGLVQYGAEPLPGTREGIHPDWRTLDKAVKAAHRNRRRLPAKQGALTDADDGAGIQKKAEYRQDVQTTQAELERLRAQRKNMPRKVPLSSWPREQRPTQLLPLNKRLTDTVKMIAYRQRPPWSRCCCRT